ncbi:hypothetical protein LRHMDP2_260 [Lacticaseibacillus rhamnosus LRHMDP2]|uniref:Transposase n=1 Tax=Lacticaseibacillus rhamnosus LRHMDP3 TaxID=1203259 RepID=A0AB33XWE7_LACRH|nr:hypothetical protein LRHMDP3_993 [Lacticaseibacillus rhamnosus LRHMDP3]EKS54019.1 hypothetical protein LRHMDP2_260 [Lacticaseibacillus rhamnosus LRHMDP2]
MRDMAGFLSKINYPDHSTQKAVTWLVRALLIKLSNKPTVKSGR